jgi:hypothetical protein
MVGMDSRKPADPDCAERRGGVDEPIAAADRTGRSSAFALIAA